MYSFDGSKVCRIALHGLADDFRRIRRGPRAGALSARSTNTTLNYDARAGIAGLAGSVMVNSAPGPSTIGGTHVAAVVLHDGLDDVQPQAARSLGGNVGIEDTSSSSGAMPEPSSRTTISNFWPCLAPGMDQNGSARRHGVHGVQNRLISTRSQAQWPPSSSPDSTARAKRISGPRPRTTESSTSDGVGQDCFERRRARR